MAIRAPALPSDAVWLNVEHPLSPADLAGRLVLMHFWTYACINCQHALQSLAAIERELVGEPFLIVSIHSPKFPTQREAEMVREAVRQLEVTHPVVLDPDARITQSFAVSGWPTMVFVGPTGAILATGRGEPEPQALLAAIRQALAAGRREGTLGAAPVALSRGPADAHPLSFPGAVIAGTTGGQERLLVADAGHHQVVVCDASGERYRIGSGVAGCQDGPRGAAQFHRPCGLALAGETLYVADTANHAVRAVDLATGEVTTVVGGPVPCRLRSPWGLAWDGRRLFVSSAGTHQIWAYAPASGQAQPFAGTGAEGGRDGAACEAYFAQPSGLALAGGVLYVADSETSSIRAVSDLDAPPGQARVRTVCGAGDLFGFGDRDGVGPAAELQHPVGIAAGAEGLLWVADTFNHKIRTVDPASGACRTRFGNGDSELDATAPAGTDLGPGGPGRPMFCVPEALAWRPDGLVVADTGNHRLLSVRLDDGTRRVLIGST